MTKPDCGVSKQIRVRLTLDAWRALRMAVAEDGTNVSTLVSELILKRLTDREARRTARRRPAERVAAAS